MNAILLLAALVAGPAPIDISEVWSAHPVGFSLLTYSNTQYVAFYDQERRMTVAWRTLDEPSFRLHRLVDPGKVTPGKWSPTQLVWDSHNSVTMAVDSAGQLHVTGNMHCHPLVYFRTTRPGDPTSLTWIGKMVGDHEDRCTYPRFLRGPSGELIFAYRHGRSGNGVDYYNRYDLTTQTWKRLVDAPLLDGQNKCNAYSIGPIKGPDGFYHLCWVWRDTPDCSTNHDLGYARSRDLVHWETSAGQPLTLPITQSTAEIVDPVPPKGGIINGNTKIGFDSAGRVIISYHKHDANGKTQIYNARRDVNGWTIVQASQWDWRWDFSGGGTIVFGITVSPVSLTADGKLVQTWRHREYGSGGWYLDEATLKPTGPYRSPATSFGPLQSKFPGMRARAAEDLGQSDDKYLLRWETLDANRDQPRQGELPPPSMLRLYRVPPERINLRQRGWYCGDSHVHMIHGEQQRPVSFDTVALAARAAGLDYLSLCQAWQIADSTPESLATALEMRSQANCVLTWGIEAPKNYYRGDAGRCLGHCWTLGLRGRTPTGADVIGLLMQASAHDYESEKPPFANFESHALIHAQGGAVFYSHPARSWIGAWGGQGGYPRREKMRISNLAVELPLDALLGPTFDGLDLFTSGGEAAANQQAFAIWATLLNHGYRVAATASSDACFDRPGGATPGSARTYTYLDEPFSLAAVTRATAHGRTFATTGPLLLAMVDGKPPGTAFAIDGHERTLKVEARADDLNRVEVLRNGVLFQTIACTGPTLTTNVMLRETQTAWYCVRVPGKQRAITSAFYFGGTPPAPVAARVQVKLTDARTGAPLNGTVTEVTYSGPLPTDGPSHAVTNGNATLTVPGTVRLRAAVPGHQTVTLSLFLDNPPLRDFITGLSAEDLSDWRTFEHVRDLLQNIQMEFKLP